MAGLKLAIAVTVTTTGDADSYISMWPERLSDAQFGIHVRGSYRDAKSKIGAEKIRFVTVIKTVTNEGWALFE
jgi:hypothetical protein